MPKPEAQEQKEGQEEESTKRPPMQNKGFAFVWMLSKKDAEKALEGCNGKTIRAGLAEELVLAKQKKKKQLRLEKKMMGMSVKEGEAAGEEDGQGDGEKGEAEDEEDEDRKNATERIIAVDWALSKEKWKEEKAKIEEAAVEDSDVEMGSGSESEASGSGSDSEDEGLGVHEEGSDDDEVGSSQDGLSDFEDERDSDEEEPVKPQLPAPEAGTTLFIRNVPYIATEDELRTLFRAFGPLRYARITMDPSTGRSRGTGFACFWNKEDADKVLEQAEILRAETGLNSAVCVNNHTT